MIIAEKAFHITADEAPGELMYVDKIDGHVDSDGVHARPDKGLSPTAEVPDLDNQIKQGHEQAAVPGGDEDK